MKKIKSVAAVLALVLLMAVPVQAANAEARATYKCWCGGTLSSGGPVTGMTCRERCGAPVYSYSHSGFLHSTQAFYCLNGHQN